MCFLGQDTPGRTSNFQSAFRTLSSDCIQPSTMSSLAFGRRFYLCWSPYDPVRPSRWSSFMSTVTLARLMHLSTKRNITATLEALPQLITISIVQTPLLPRQLLHQQPRIESECGSRRLKPYTLKIHAFFDLNQQPAPSQMAVFPDEVRTHVTAPGLTEVSR